MHNNRSDNTLPQVKHTLEADGIYLSFGDKRVLQSVYVKVETGRVTGLLGRNGCGKSCLMRIIYGNLDIPDKSVRIDGKFVKYGYTKGVAYSPQHDFIPRLRSVRNVMKDYRLDFGRLISYFPVLEKYYTYPVGILSGGEKRILETFIVLASDSLFTLLDEPFSQVSPIHIEAIKNMIREEKRTKGIMVSDHMYREICGISDDLYVIVNGKTYLTESDDDLRKLGYIR